jgi:O-antigen/teichoic acid export membrane protein
VRIIVLRHEGVDAAGLYQAAWAVGGLYAGFILQAMGTDFYPRLTAVANDHATCNRTVNEQTEISILLAGPGVLATLTFAPLIIHVFYTAEFYPAIDLLRWISLGMMLRILSWPMGFIIIAKGARRAFFIADAAAAVVHVALAFMLVPRFGVIGAGMAFFGYYVWHTAFVAAITWHMTGFRWSAGNLKCGSAYMAASLAVFALFAFADFRLATAVGILASGVGGIHTLRRLLVMLPKENLPALLRPWRETLARLARV